MVFLLGENDCFFYLQLGPVDHHPGLKDMLHCQWQRRRKRHCFAMPMEDFCGLGVGLVGIFASSDHQAAENLSLKNRGIK